METKEMKMYAAPEVECVECELESAILNQSGQKLGPGESEDGELGEDL